MNMMLIITILVTVLLLALIGLVNVTACRNTRSINLLLDSDDRQRIAEMQLFVGMGKIMEILESKPARTKWKEEDSQAVIKAMEEEKERLWQKTGRYPQQGNVEGNLRNKKEWTTGLSVLRGITSPTNRRGL